MAHLRRRAFINQVSEVPIMSFQTDKNGTFNPSLTIPSGTLRWVIDGEEQITNSPSKVLTGSTVNVQVFANDVLQDAACTSNLFQLQNIIGSVSFEYFTKTGTLWAYGNSLLDGFTLSNNVNSSNNCRLHDCNLSSLDFSNTTVIGNFWVYQNPLLSSITFSANPSSSAAFRVFSNNLSSLNLTSWTMSGNIQVYDNPSLTTFTMPTYTTTLANYWAGSCALNLTTVDLIFSSLNTFFSSNAPTVNLNVQTHGGTNASPTGGASNTDLVNLRDVVYPNAGKTFTANIN